VFLVEAALAGGFATAVPRNVARDAIADGRLTVLDEIRPAHDGIHALYVDGQSAQLAKQAVDALEQIARRA
jgi:DNA-binding transcriptional LysR family regulator